MNIDLIFVTKPSRTMTAMLTTDGGEVVKFGPVPSYGAFGPIADRMFPQVREHFDTANDLGMYLSLRHAAFMQRGANDAGQPYPLKLDAS